MIFKYVTTGDVKHAFPSSHTFVTVCGLDSIFTIGAWYSDKRELKKRKLCKNCDKLIKGLAADSPLIP